MRNNVIVDFHVHLYRGYDLLKAEEFLRLNVQSRFPNLPDHSPVLLCLTEREGQHWYRDISQGNRLSEILPPSWEVNILENGASIRIETSGNPLILIPGRQIITAEKLELLCLGVDLDVNDGIGIENAIETIKNSGGIPVVPWSPGKWLGKRRKVLLEVLNKRLGLYLGDTAIRSLAWLDKGIFDIARQQGLPILPGSDPLPAKNEERVFGSHSAVVDISADEPVSALLEYLKKTQSLKYPVSSGNLWSTLSRMVRLRLAKIEL